MVEIILFGSSGVLGKELIKLQEFDSPSQKEVDITNFDQTRAYIEKVKPYTIIHSAALVGAKECEEDREVAYAVNVLGTRNIAKVCLDNQIKMIYLSTDSIFDGEKGDYKEEDTPNPINYYSLTKLLGEAYVQMLDSSLIIRTSFFSPDSFSYERAFTDQYTCRMKADDLAKEIILATNNDVKGIVHIAGKKDTLYNIIKKVNPNIGKITRLETGLNLPKDLSLNTDKWAKIKGDFVNGA